MIQVNREGSKVIIQWATALWPLPGWKFSFSFDTGAEYAASLLADFLNKEFSNVVEKARRDAYERGWSDAKKKLKKATWFSPVLKHNDDKYQIG